MNTNYGILKKLFLLMCILSTFMLNGCTSKPDLPDIDKLAREFLSIMQNTTVNFGKSPQKLTDYYKLLRFEKTNGSEVGAGGYRIEFQGEVELIETIYNYGRYGHKRYFLPTKMGFIAYKGKVDKGTVIEFTGSADYELTERGWSNEKHAVVIKSKLAPKI